ncbi:MULTISPECIES: hypothetical protein [Deinococcus]|uniref:Uncharacterized protein n=1 Tax=Deinococcus cavernae TaxID=2320857 RepID=A0A418UZJ2_9DEIO|nr:MULTISPECIES: hypothetical protein [Deinococcus]RJF68919.1 hypothetical protein D3875_21455 [Deinococcus cavernae]
MPAELPVELLLTGIARGRGSAEMMLELLGILHDKGVLTEAEVRRVVNVLAADMSEFNLELRQGHQSVPLKG